MKITETFVCIDNMRFRARHGVMPQEQDTGGTFEVSMRIGYPFAASLDTDDVNDTINYANVYELVKKEMQQPSHLIEHVVGRITKKLFAEFPSITSVDIKLKKINPPMGADCDGVYVEIHAEN